MNKQEKESKIYVQIEKWKDRRRNVDILTDGRIRNGEQERKRQRYGDRLRGGEKEIFRHIETEMER